MVGDKPFSEASHQTARLAPGRHQGPGDEVCVMELASMLAGERFSDRPKSVCPLIGAVLRSYNDSLDEPRRQDLYRFSAQAVGTRGDFELQRARSEVALEVAREARLQAPRGKRLPEPEPDAGPERIADFVVESIARRAHSRYRNRRWDDASHERMVALLDRMIAIGSSPAFDALLGELVEHPSEPVEDGGGGQEIVIAELAESSQETWSEPRIPLLHQCPPPFGEGGVHHPPVAVGAAALHETMVGEGVEHLGDAGRPQICRERKLTGGHLLPIAQAEEQRVLSVAELPRPVALAPAHPTHRGHRALERSAQLVGAVALVALACDARRRAR
jgi:hypothetical protein